MPRIGCGLAGERWDLIEPIIEQTPCKNGTGAFSVPNRDGNLRVLPYEA